MHHPEAQGRSAARCARVAVRFQRLLMELALGVLVASCGAEVPRDTGGGSWQADGGGASTGSSPGASTGATNGAQGSSGGGIDADAGHQAGGDGGGVVGQPSPQCPVRDNGRPAWHGLHASEMLGARVVAGDQVEFSLFAPAASSVSVIGSFNGNDPNANSLAKGADGIWTATVSIPNAHGQGYRFLVDGRSVADVYSRANDGNGGDSIIVARSDFAWSDGAFVRKPREQLVIYESHVADFTRDDSSGVSADKRGKFLGFAEKLDHLKRIGINAVELMPVVENQSDGYDWGYSASLFFAPESTLASSRRGAQINELKSMVNELHRAGIAVIADVVFNHVWGQTGSNHFWGVDPVYYFDYDDNGDPENDKVDWGYLMATQRPLMRKLMYDNLKYLMTEFHLDGFRLDGTKHMSSEAVIEVIRELDDDGFCDRYFIAEEFDGEHNERIRELNAELGHTALSSWGTGYKNHVWDAIRYPSSSMTDLTHATYFSQGDGWNRSDEVVIYMSSHDEGTINAWLDASKDQVKVAATHLLTAAGLPMLWMGDELMRPHLGNHGTNATAEENNRFDWNLATTHADLVDYYGAMVRLRTSHKNLYAAQTGAAGTSFVWDNESPERALGYARRGAAGDRDFVILVNYQDHDQDYQVAFPHTGTWHLMANGRTAKAEVPGLSSLDVQAASTSVRVPATSAFVYMSAAINP